MNVWPYSKIRDELLFLHLGVDFIVAVFACLYAGRLLNFSIKND